MELGEIYGESFARMAEQPEKHSYKPYSFLKKDMYREMEEELLDFMAYAAMQIAKVRRLRR